MTASVALGFLVLLPLLVVPCAGAMVIPFAVASNPVFEVVCLRRPVSLGEGWHQSMGFLERNWQPWVAINSAAAVVLLVAVVGPFVVVRLMAELLGAPEVVFEAIGVGIAAPATFVLLVVRGTLFAELDRSSHRARLFQARASTEQV